MTTRTKSTLLLSVTLVIGMVLGAVINAYVAKRRFEHVGYLRSERGLARHLENAIEPRDEAQRTAIRAILEKSAARICSHMDSSAAEGRVIMNETKAELAKVLTLDQMERLEKVSRPPDRARMRGRMPGGPGGGPGPPH